MIVQLLHGIKLIVLGQPFPGNGKNGDGYAAESPDWQTTDAEPGFLRVALSLEQAGVINRRHVFPTLQKSAAIDGPPG